MGNVPANHNCCNIVPVICGKGTGEERTPAVPKDIVWNVRILFSRNIIQLLFVVYECFLASCMWIADVTVVDAGCTVTEMVICIDNIAVLAERVN